MSSLATQDRIAAPQTAPAVSSYAAPAWSPVQAETSQATPTAQPGLSDEQRALDQAAAAEAGMGPAEVSTLSTFGLRPSEMDIDAARRVNVGLQRMAALLACEEGNTTACELAGPGSVGHESWEGVSGDTSEDLVVEDADYAEPGVMLSVEA